jgi:hypothetical protein
MAGAADRGSTIKALREVAGGVPKGKAEEGRAAAETARIFSPGATPPPTQVVSPKSGLWSRVPLSLKAVPVGVGVGAAGLGVGAPVAAASLGAKALQPRQFPHIYGGGVPLPGGGL